MDLITTAQMISEYSESLIVLIENEEIDHHIDRYIHVYKEYGAVSFQLRKPEYRALQGLTKSYSSARLDSEFTHETWSHGAREKGLYEDEKATFVFGFLMFEWSSKTTISAREQDDFIILTVSKRAAN